MKKSLILFLALASALASWSQTGTGILILTDPSVTFTPTTVDSTTTINLQVVNTVGVAQTLFVDAPSAPFALSDEGPLSIAANDTLGLSVSFTPTSIGDFSDTFGLVGNIFGAAEISLAGQGIQVILEWTPSALQFDTTAIGQSDTQFIVLSSVGDGAATISAVEFSNPIFSVDEDASAFSIDQGTSDTIFVTYAPINAGLVNETMTLHTNDPNNSSIEIALSAVGISEVSGEICDITWTLINSPYTLVGDVVVPEGCTLNIDPGVEVIGNDYDIEVFGAFFANGEEGNEVQIEVGELLSHTSADNMALFYSNILETREYGELQRDFSIYNNENGGSLFFGKYEEDFTDNEAQGWTFSGGVTSSDFNGTFYVYYDSGNSGSYPTHYVYSPIFSFNNSMRPESVSYRQWMDWWDDCNDYSLTYISINGDSWVEIDYFNCDYNASENTTISHELSTYTSSYEEIETLQIRWQTRFRYYYWMRIDDFVLTTNLFSASANTTSEEGLSTGGIQLFESTFIGDFESVQDSLEVILNNSSVNRGDARAKQGHGLGLYADHVQLSTHNATVGGHALDGIHVSSLTMDWINENSLIMQNGEDGIDVNGNLELVASELDVIDNGMDGLQVGENSNLTVIGARIQDNGARAISAQTGSVIELDYVLMDDNGGRGIELGTSGALSLGNCRLRGNDAEGIYSGSPVSIDHSDIAFSGGTGLVLTGNNFHTLNNSILWGNNSTNYTQIDIEGGVISTSYSTVQGRSSYGTTGSGQYYWGEGVIEADPLFADDDLHLEIFSPCVDGGQPWHQDAYMPFGLGGVRADMGMYGGADNAYWGGEALPDGASQLSGVSDSPQDQGGVVGLVFDASFYDNSDLVNNVTSYAFWRHYDPTGEAIATLDEGNWELIGEMPAQSFNGYAYQAQTLGNTNAFGTFSSCYTVVAHTDDEDTYWYSNVMCGESVDNLAPDAPELNGMILADGGAQISWPTPAEEDYAFTEVFSDAGFSVELGTDTVVVDETVVAGNTYMYTAVHYDVNGNASEPVSLTLAVSAGLDAIALHAGWNLISIDRSLNGAQVADVFEGLQPGNLQYVTGFQGGVEFYDPSGLSFLNTLGALTDGYGYWVKVAEDDVLEVAGSGLPMNYRPALEAGWNLIGYPNAAAADPAVYFADLIADENLVYVTGFDQGAQVFDPNGLAFLNTLQELENGFGYWVKTVSGEDANGLAPVQTKSNPNYMILNGTSDLTDAAGEQVDVLGPNGEVLAQLDILEGGYLMTAAVFGKDPSEAGLAGLELGAELSFAFRGEQADQRITFEGQMLHKRLELTFSGRDVALTAAPNPAKGAFQADFTLQDATADAQVVIRDLAGRTVQAMPLGGLASGHHVRTVEVADLAAGAYQLSLECAGVVKSTTRLVIEH